MGEAIGKRVALVTGGASGIGLAACLRLAADGYRVAVADLQGDRLEAAVRDIARVSPDGSDAVAAFPTDVASRELAAALVRAVRDRFGRIDTLMANAGIQPGSDILGAPDAWDRILQVNLHGIVHVVQAALPGLIADGRGGTVIVTGSKQGITTPPGDPAYNVAKAGVKAFAEALEHDLRNRVPRPDDPARIRAHLLIPGFVFTGLTAKGRTEKPAAAWTPEQTVDFMFERIGAGDFYALCPDNDVDRRTDEKRMAWAIGDIIENRPPLSRWHQDFKAQFERSAGTPN